MTNKISKNDLKYIGKDENGYFFYDETWNDVGTRFKSAHEAYLEFLDYCKGLQ